MNRLHGKNLRMMFDVSDANVPVSEEVASRIGRMEARLARFFGRFSEMSVETLALLVNGLTKRDVFPTLAAGDPGLKTEPVGPSQEEIGLMTGPQLKAALVERDVGMSGKESANRLRDMLTEALEQGQVELQEATEG